MYIFLKSNDSDKIHIQNTKYSFTCEIPQEILLEGVWSCAIVQCNIGLNPEKQDITILSDIIEDSVLHGVLAPVFTIVSTSGSVDYPYYIPLCRNRIHRIKIKLINTSGEKPNISQDYTTFVLHFKKD